MRPPPRLNFNFETKTCCHCGNKIGFEVETCNCGLDPDQKAMENYGVTIEGIKYKFQGHYFSKKVDALKFAMMKTKQV